jgi:hypothetical protein
MPYPSKANWTSSGRTHQKLTIENVPQPSLQYYTQPSLPDLSNYRIVDFFGDSIIRMMVTADGEWVPKRHRKYYKQNVFFSNNVRSHLTNETVEHFFTKHFMKNHYLRIKQNWGNVAVVMGSAAWDLNPKGMMAHDDHVIACRRLIESILESFPGLKIYWKLPYAMHQHNINCETVEDRKQRLDCEMGTKYVTSSRVEHLYQKQKALMEELDITYLDLYETTYLSAHKTIPNDGMHYLESWNQDVLDWFYPFDNSTNHSIHE